jgi:hypothetical protein
VSQPAVASAAQELYDRLAPIYGVDDEANDWALLRLCEAHAAGLQLFDDVDATAELPAWAVLFDADLAPDWGLPWLAWVLGLVVRGETLEQLRALIRDRPPAKRGTPAAMRAAVASTLTDTKTVRYIERASHPFRDLVITSPSETPDPAATTAAAETQLRAFTVLETIVTDDAIIDEGELTIDSVDDAVTIDTATLADIT